MTGQDSSRLNGSVGMLAKAMRQVFTEAMDETRNGMRSDMREEISAAEERLNKHVDEKIDTTNQNMQAQFAEVHKTLGEQGKALTSRTS